MSLSHVRVAAYERVLAGAALVFLLPLLGSIALGLRLETRRAILRSTQRLIRPNRPFVITLFQTRRLSGQLGAFGGMLKKTGLYQLPLLMDICAGRLPLDVLVSSAYKSTSTMRAHQGLKASARHLARRPEDRYRSAA